MYVQKAILLDAAAMERSLMRISHEIVERNEGRDGLCVVGVYRRGAVLAEKIARNVEKITGLKPRLGALDITFAYQMFQNAMEMGIGTKVKMWDKPLWE